jgi:molybdate transport system ATP-binding protein
VGPLEFQGTLGYPTGFTLDVAFTTDAAVTALVGPSGSGKTSILEIVAGLRRLDAGRIRLGRRLLFDSRAGVDLPPERRRIGYVPQDHRLFPHCTVRQNLEYGWRRRPRGTAAPDLAEVAKVLELADLLDRWPLTLSGGQQQRVALGRALLCGPELLLFDEPLAALDLELRGRLLDYLEAALKRWAVPTVYVSHAAAEVQRLAGRVIELAGGRRVGSTPPPSPLP